MRRSYDGQLQRHFVGQVDSADGVVVRATGYVFIYDEKIAQYIKKTPQRTTILNLAESGYFVNLIPSTVNLDDLRYEVIDRTNLVITDGKGFVLDINEFSAHR
jgi:hypothetical protein